MSVDKGSSNSQDIIKAIGGPPSYLLPHVHYLNIL